MPANPVSAKAGVGTGVVQALAKQLRANVDRMDANPGTTVSIVHTHVAVIADIRSRNRRIGPSERGEACRCQTHPLSGYLNI